MVLTKIMKFLYYPFFLGKMGQQKVFNNAVDRKLVFLDCKNIDLKKSQIGIFPKGVSPRFWGKLINFFVFSFYLR